MLTPFKTILFEKEQHIATIALNRPDALNSFNVEMRNDFCQALSAIMLDREIRVVVLKGIGEKAFCAGADLSEFLTAPPPVKARAVRWERDIWGMMASISQPIIAALHGFVLGSGIEMSLFCDIRIAATNSRFGLPEVKLGMIPAAGGTQTLPRTIGSAGALNTLLTNKWMSAEEALEAGLVNRLVAESELLDCVTTLAGTIADQNPDKTAVLKKAISSGMELPLFEALQMEHRIMRQFMTNQS